MNERQWYYFHNRSQEGPVPESALRNRFESGELPLDSLVWTESLSDWKAASEEA